MESKEYIFFSVIMFFFKEIAIIFNILFYKSYAKTIKLQFKRAKICTKGRVSYNVYIY